MWCSSIALSSVDKRVQVTSALFEVKDMILGLEKPDEWQDRFDLRVNDLAKRIGAIEDFTGDDECQNQLLRR